MIKIKRISSTIDYSVPYKVLIDGRPIMELMNNTLKSYELVEGKHTIKIKSQDFVSEELKFEIYPGQNIEFEVKPDHKDNQFSKITRKLLFSKIGIAIEKKGDFYI